MRKLIIICLLLFLSFQVIGQIKPWFVKDKIKINDSLKLLFKNHSASGDWVLALDTVTYKVGIKQVSAGGGDLSFSDTLTKISTWTMDNLRLLKTDTNHFAHASDTSGNAFAGKTWTNNKFATLANLALKINISDTASLVYSQSRANEIFALKSSTGTSYWELKTAGSSYILPSSSKKVMLNTLYAADSSKIFYSNEVYNGGSVAIGIGACIYSANYNHNVYIGSLSGYVATGSYNCYVGSLTGFNNYAAGGSRNTFIGGTAGYLATGSSNTLLGCGAGSSASGSYNTFGGDGSGYSSTGSNNTFFGYWSGFYMTTESGRTIISPYDRTNKAGDTTKTLYLYNTSSGIGQVMYWGGDLTYQLRHAHLYFNDSSEVINLTQNVYTHLTNETKTLFTVDESSNVTCAGDTITIVTPGDYLLSFDFVGDGAGVNDIYKFKLYKNNTAVAGGTLSKGAVSAVGWNWYIEDAVAGDDFKIMVTNTVDNDDLTAINGVIYIRKEH